ncbi:hypothetical protein GGI08_005807, partial [Coemansia sp. S2]
MVPTIRRLWRSDKAETSSHDSDAPSSETDSVKSAPKNIGLFSATAMGVSLMIGSGIFSTPASILRLVGTPAMTLILWGLGAIISYGGATAFIELGLMYRKNGGTMRFLAHGFPRPKIIFAYLFAWVMVMCI